MKFIEKYSKEISIIIKNMIDIPDDMEQNISKISNMLDDVDNVICYSIFPVLVKLFEDNNNDKLLSLIAKTKYKAMICKPTEVDINELISYLESLMRISYKFSIQSTIENDTELSTSYKNLCYGNFFSTHSTDSIGFYKSPQFNKPIAVKCKYCSNEVLDFEVKEENITPLHEISFDAYNSQILNRMESLQNLDLMGIADETYLLYGSYNCECCNKKNIVIKSHANYFLSKENYKQLSLEDIIKLDENLNSLIAYDFKRDMYSDLLVFSGEYIANLYWDNLGIDCLYPYVRLLNNSMLAYRDFGYEYIKMLVNSSINAIEKYTGSDFELLGYIYREMGNALSLPKFISNEEKINSHKFLQKGYEYYLKAYGKDNKQTFYAKRDANYMLAKLDENNIKPLLEDFEFMKNSTKFSDSIVKTFGHCIAPLIQEKDIALAIKLQEDYIEYLACTHGEESINVAIHKNTLSKFYIKSCDYPKSFELLNFSLNIFINILGKEVFNNIINDLNLDLNKNEINTINLKQTAEIICNFGDYYSNISDYENSVKHYKYSLKLYSVYQDILKSNYLLENAEIYIKLGKVYLLNNNQNSATISFETAIDIYNTCLEITNLEDEFYQVQEFLSSANNLLNSY